MLVPYVCDVEKHLKYFQEASKDPYARFRSDYLIISPKSELPDESPQLEPELSDRTSQEEYEVSEESSQKESDILNETSRDESEVSEESDYEFMDDEREREIVKNRRLILKKYHYNLSQTRNDESDNSLTSFGREVNRLLEILKSCKNKPDERSMSDNPNFILKSHDEEESMTHPVRRIMLMPNGEQLIGKQKEARHICALCSAKFVHYHHMIRHQKTKHERILYTCPVCQKAFSRKDALKRHMDSHK